jgi:hypothetical protein
MSLWRNGDFLRLWSAQTISQFGSQITLLALPLAAILVLDASAFEVAALTAVEWTPWLLFSLPAGAWVDRLRRRRVLVVTDLGRAAAIVSIPVAYALDALTLWQLYGVGFLTGTLTVFFDVAYVAYLPSLVERRQLGDGNSKLEITRSGAQLGGPGLAGLLVPFASSFERLSTALGQIAAYGMLGLGLTFYVRRRLGSQRWRRAHRAIPVFWALAVGHALLTGTDRGAWWFLAAILLPALACGALLAQRYGGEREAPAADRA